MNELEQIKDENENENSENALADDEHSPDRDVNSYLLIPSKSRIWFVPSLDRLIERWSELSSVRLSHL